MKPSNHFISADHAIQHWRSLNYSYQRIQLPGFEAYDSGHIESPEMKSQYDSLLLLQIGDYVDFYATRKLESHYERYNLPKPRFIDWLATWYYDDDLIIQSDSDWITVFHHSGFIFYLNVNQDLPEMLEVPH